MTIQQFIGVCGLAWMGGLVLGWAWTSVLKFFTEWGF